VAERTRQALKRFGADPDPASVDAVAARVLGSVVKDRIVAAFDRLLWQDKTARVRDMLRRLDSDPYRDKVRDAVLANDPARIVELAAQKEAMEQPPGFAAAMAGLGEFSVERRRELLQSAVRRRPGDLGLLMTLSGTYRFYQRDGADERARWGQAAVATAPDNYAAYMNLGVALGDRGDADGAIACFRKAIELNPKLIEAHGNLGAVLCDVKRDYDGAIASFRKVIEVKPTDALAYANLGNALRDKGDVDGAIVWYKKAIELDPKLKRVHTNLGSILASAKGEYDEAIVLLRKAIEIDPTDAQAHTNLGLTLQTKGKVDEAIVWYKKAIELDPKLALAHYNLGNALKGKGDRDGAVACFKKAVELDPKNPFGYNGLASICYESGRLDESEAQFQHLIRLFPTNSYYHDWIAFIRLQVGDPHGALPFAEKAVQVDLKSAQAYWNLGRAQSGLGEYQAAVASFRQVLKLDPKHGGPPSQLPRAERLAAVQERLPAFLKGEFEPSGNEERLALAVTCKQKKHYQAAVGLYSKVFTIEATQAENLPAWQRYQAGCCAALAAAGQGEDAGKPDDQGRADLRKQALSWLRADLAARTRRLESGQPAEFPVVRDAMTHWQKDGDLAGIRDAAALAKLPADEQKAFTQFWSDVAALLKKAEEQK
jgi:superkiller protein 3